MKKSLIIPFLLVLIIIGFFAFLYYRNTIFSKEVLRLEILGAESAKLGEEIQYTIKYKNNGNFVLEKPKLIFEMPENSLTEDDKTRIEKELKDIYPGDEETISYKVRLLGKEGDLKEAKAYLSYKPKNLTARYEADTTFTTKIENVPITLEFDIPSKVEKGKEAAYALNYFSNVDYPLEDISIKIDAVSGFDIQWSNPTSLDKSEWKIPTLNKAQGGRISVKGRVNAEAGSRLTFGASIGVWRNGQYIVIKQATKEIEVISPLLFISQQINGSANYVASPGDALHYEIFFRNIGTTAFENLFMMVRIDGSAFDLSTLEADGGQARPNDNLIVWDSKQVPQLIRLDPQEESKVEFDIKLKPDWSPSESEQNSAVLKTKVDISGISQEFETKINSKLEVLQKAYYSNQQGISNSGPIPPTVGKTTTYTIVWQIKNYANNLKNVKVKAVLPQGVGLTGKISPESQAGSFSMDGSSREVVWSIGNVSAGAGVSGVGPTLAFQVSVNPVSSQRGSTVSLIGKATVTGEDQFTDAIAQSSSSSLNTNLPDDGENSGKGTVK